MTQSNMSTDAALDHAIRLLTERFGQADQQAAVSLASLLYSSSARESFLDSREQEPPYAGGQTR